MKPLFTLHAGEFLVDTEIEQNFRRVNVWIPAKDTGIDLLVSNYDNTKTVSLQVKFSRDYNDAYVRDTVLRDGIRVGGWWTPTRQQIESSRANYWVFVLYGLTNRRTKDFIIVKPSDLLKRLRAIHGSRQKFQTYLWVTERGKCWEARGLNRADKLAVARDEYRNDARDFTAYINDWTPIAALNG
jgi:hypothetical protein